MYHRRRAACGSIAGGLVLYYVRDVVLGWCFVITAGFALLYGIGSPPDRWPYINRLTEYGITEPFAIREQIEWDAVRRGRLLFRASRSGCCLRPRLRRSS